MPDSLVSAGPADYEDPLGLGGEKGAALRGPTVRHSRVGHAFAAPGLWRLIATYTSTSSPVSWQGVFIGGGAVF